MTAANHPADVNQAATDSAALSTTLLMMNGAPVPSAAVPSAGVPSDAAPSEAMPHLGSIPIATSPTGSGAVSSASPPSSAAAPTGGLLPKTGHEKFGTFELAIVMSHYDIGAIRKIKEFPRGSRKAPKLLIKTQKEAYLLKRRAKGKDDAFKVAFCHQLQLYLAGKQFPLPHLIGTRGENNSMLQWGEHVYELFEFIKGVGYDSSLEQTGDSGKILAIFHKLLRDFKSDYTPPTGSYHGSRYVTTALDRIPATLGKFNPLARTGDEIQQLSNTIHGAYASAMLRVNDLGLLNWPAQIVHADWHPGNMLFRGQRVVAVIDYDAARNQQRIIDVANGALQFSILGGGDDPTAWPEGIDETRFKEFLTQYDGTPGGQLSRAELKAIPWLMIEALIAEAAIPIANTGQFARMAGYQFLSMVERKVRWFQQNADRLAGILG